MNSASWQALRALRAAPTGAAAVDPDRRQIVAASLRQAEELADAAQAAGYAAKPLPLFYSLSQAGRAIAAVHLSPQGILRGHGLSVPPDQQVPLLETVVRMTNPGNHVDSFRGVAQAVNSPLLLGRVQLGELWAANPDLRDVPIPVEAGSWHKALEIPIGGERIGGVAYGEPEPDPETHPVTTAGFVSMSVDLAGETGGEIEEAVRSYPTLRSAFGLKQGPGSERAGANDQISRSVDNNGVLRAEIAMDAPKQTNMADLWARRRAFASIVEVDENQPRYPVPSLVGFALPEIGGGSCPHPLMLWWALLLGLSSLARYEPATWTAAIDLDESVLAVSLERVLDVASERVPVRVLQSLKETNT